MTNEFFVFSDVVVVDAAGRVYPVNDGCISIGAGGGSTPLPAAPTSLSAQGKRLTDEDLAAVLADLVPADDWVCEGTFAVNDWAISATDYTAAIVSGFVVGEIKSNGCECPSCSQGVGSLGIVDGRARGVYIDGSFFQNAPGSYNTPAGVTARAIALKLALDTNPGEVDRMACG